jgi:hypothetical protein
MRVNRITPTDPMNETLIYFTSLFDVVRLRCAVLMSNDKIEQTLDTTNGQGSLRGIEVKRELFVQFVFVCQFICLFVCQLKRLGSNIPLKASLSLHP